MEKLGYETEEWKKDPNHSQVELNKSCTYKTGKNFSVCKKLRHISIGVPVRTKCPRVRKKIT